MDDEMIDRRANLGMVVGSFVAVASISLFAGRDFLVILIPGLLLATVVYYLFLVPMYFKLRAAGRLKIWWALLLGAVASCLPGLILIIHLTLNLGTSTVFSRGALLIDRGWLTGAGFYQFFIADLLMFIPPGIVGALAGWLVAFGFCIQPKLSGTA